VCAAPYLGLRLPHEIEQLLLLLCRWLFRLCAHAGLHGYPTSKDTRENVIGFFKQVSTEWAADTDVAHPKVEKQADMISNLLLRVLPQLANNYNQSIMQVIQTTAKQVGQIGHLWDNDILDVWPGIALILFLHSLLSSSSPHVISSRHFSYLY
jgi:hypothetical protein